MLFYKGALLILPFTFILSVYSQLIQESIYLDNGLAFFYIASGALAGKIIYDRYQQINILSSLTPNPNVTSFANKIASYSVSLLSLGFLVYYFLFLLKVNNNNNGLTALSIFICGFGTLYIWMQCIITTYISSLYYERYMSVLRQCLANASFLTLVLMAVFGTVSSFLPKGSSSGASFCFHVTSLCSYLMAAFFCIFILSFEKDQKYFSEGLQAELLFDDTCSFSDNISELDSMYETQEINPDPVITATLKNAKKS